MTLAHLITPTHMSELINTAMLVFMAVTALAVARLRNLFVVVMLTGIYSFVAAALYVVLDAVDVAFTEAAVGAGVATVLMLGTLALTKDTEKVTSGGNALKALVLVTITGAVLIWATFDMPLYGDPNAPINRHVAPRYIAKSGEETDVPNIVTSVLASYRGYDTMGETFVIFTAAAGVITIIGRAPRKRRRKGSGGGEA